MRLLLDTHVLLWWLTDDDSLSSAEKDLIDTAPEVFVSAASVWEISIKQAAGKLSVPDGFSDALSRSGLRELPIRFQHARLAGALPALHRDPFDRMLVAQAQCDQLTLLTRDPAILDYDVATRAV
ncbi:type II toxin-antitoxin system VapC family toxin [Georgenia faecalis]|uniref:Type II toxin-antitoxin system VapC family toxin n=1 Tax=Georgenia faecalis TaxID=2483799 RepID=A0ABV9DBP6_9MICO|nr:type II toxin-antitoxin system VapC family toxin [Georgenia faecalis]